MKMLRVLALCVSICLTFVISAQDKCAPIGWANYDGQTYVGPPTGGGNAVPMEVSTFSELKSAAESSGAKVIYVKISMGNGYSGTTGDVLYVKSNKTIIGYPGVTIKCSWQIKNASNIIIRNLTLRGPGNSNSEQNWDCVNIQGSSKRIWFDHCTVMDGEDGNFDFVKGADNLSVTWCIFTYSADGEHNLSNLIGSSDNESQSHGKLNVTYANCWWKNVNSRTPRSRYGQIHVINCYYSNSGGTRAGFMANQRMEACYFDGINSPIGLISPGGASGIFPINCVFPNCSGNQNAMSEGGYTVFNPPYNYQPILSAWDVKNIVTNPDCGAGPTMDSPTQCGCGSQEPELKLLTDNAFQVVNEGNALSEIVYTWGGSATNVVVTGLSEGLSVEKNKSTQTITISGVPKNSGSFTISTVQPEGDAVVLQGAITVAKPPVVEIVSPSNGFSISSPATITISAEASDPDGSISSVDFYNGNILIGTASSYPYEFVWNNVASGSYTLTAVATDNDGAVAKSSVVDFFVTRGPDSPITIQAETACEVHTGDPMEIKNPGFNGEGYVNFDNEAGTFMRFNVVSDGYQDVHMIIRHAATNQRNMSVTVNGKVQIPELDLPGTGSFENWTESSTMVSLIDGQNSIVLTSLMGDGGPNIDEITFESGTVYATDLCDVIELPDEVTQEIELVKGWNLISLNVIPKDNAIENIFKGLNVQEIKTLDDFWTKSNPSYFNTMHTIEDGNAYFVYVGHAGRLSITGFPSTKTLNPDALSGNSWILIGCPYQSVSELSKYFNADNCTQIKNTEGFWIPDDFRSSFVTFEPGKGYFYMK